MEQSAALPSISGKSADPPLRLQKTLTSPASMANSQAVPTVTGNRSVGRRTLGNIPKSAGAASRRIGKQLDGNLQQRPTLQRPSSTQSPPKRGSMTPLAAHAHSATATQFAKWGVNGLQSDPKQQPQGIQPGDGDQPVKPHESDGESTLTRVESREIQPLRDENASFRREIDFLRAKLLEKMRGPSKVVGGGQFRAASVSNASPPSVGPVMSSAMCAKCASVRAGALKARHQTAQAQATTLELQQYVDKVEEMQHTLWKERSVQQTEIAYLQSVLARRDEEFFMIQTNHTLLGMQLRALRVGKEAMEPVKSSNNRESYELLDDMTQPSSSLVPESSSDFERQLETALTDLQAAREVGRVAKEQRDLETKLRREERVVYENQISELRQSSRECLETTTLELQQRQQKELQLVQATNQQLRQDIRTKVAATEVLEQQHINAALAQQNRVRALQVQLNDKEAELTRLLTKLEALASERAAAIASNEALSKQINSLEFQIQGLTQDKLQAAVTLQQLQREGDFRAEQERVDRNRLQESELRCLAESLDAEKQHTRLLQSQLSDAKVELADHANLLLKQQRSHLQVLDRALQSTVRLCVVAPTVNVQLTTKRAQIKKNGCIMLDKMLGKTQDAVDTAPVVCRSTPAQESIRHVVEKEVLPLFTSVFLQEDEGASPQTDVPMTFWLQELLRGMQTRIASQLESIYSSATESNG